MAGTPLIFWFGFTLFVLAMLALDLGVFHRKIRTTSLKEAIGWSLFWIALALLFNGLVWWWHGPKAGMEFASGYLLEKALSVDNLFVFLLLFNFFKIPSQYQHRVLFWGIIGALIMRGLFIAAGVSLISHFAWVIYIFGGFLIYTGIKMWLGHEDDADPSQSRLISCVRKALPITQGLRGPHFFVKEDGRLMATPLFLVLILLETTDVIFALDSIPAIIAVTRDPFLVFTSNIFAILGLRSLYFALSGVMEMFRFLHHALAFVLVFIGVRMLLENIFLIPLGWSLGIIFLALATGILMSVLRPEPSALGHTDSGH